MDRDVTRTVLDAVFEICRAKALAGQRIVIADAVRDAEKRMNAEMLAKLDAELRSAHLAATFTRVLAKVAASDPLQPKLPGFESLPPITRIDGIAVPFREVNIDQYQGTREKLEKRLRDYLYPRRKPEAVKALKQQIRELKQFSRPFAKLSAGQPELPLWKAKELEAARQEKPMVRQRRKAIRKRWEKAKSGRT